MLKKWSASRGSTPQNKELRAYAKLVIALLEASEEVDIGSLLRSTAPSTPSQSPPSALLGYTERDPQVRTKKRAVIALHTSGQVVSQKVARSFVQAYQWAPVAMFVVCVACAVSLATKPELVAIVPIKLLSWLPLYIGWAASRICASVEREITAAFGLDPYLSWLALPSSEVTSSASEPLNPGPGRHMIATRPTSLLGCFIASYIAWRNS